IEQTTEQLVDLALEAGLIDVARDAVVRGLRGLPGNEELYRCRLRVEHRAGNLAGVAAAYEELVTYLADLETEPSPATAALFHDLVRPVGRR
ncbi:MAG: BTAD domain-containing putative transcriptional regulator, partial [Acidimicrobiia bacterium]